MKNLYQSFKQERKWEKSLAEEFKSEKKKLKTIPPSKFRAFMLNNTTIFKSMMRSKLLEAKTVTESNFKKDIITWYNRKIQHWIYQSKVEFNQQNIKTLGN